MLEGKKILFHIDQVLAGSQYLKKKNFIQLYLIDSIVIFAPRVFYMGSEMQNGNDRSQIIALSIFSYHKKHGPFLHGSMYYILTLIYFSLILIHCTELRFFE